MWCTQPRCYVHICSMHCYSNFALLVNFCVILTSCDPSFQTFLTLFRTYSSSVRTLSAMCRAPLSCGPSFDENLSRQITSQWQLLCGLESGRKSTTEETYSTKTLNSNRKSRKNGKSRAFRLRLEAILSRYWRFWTKT